MSKTPFDPSQPLRSPLRYPGGKTRVAKMLSQFIPEHTDYREIFAGGAAIFFHKPLVEKNWINDLQPGLHALWVTLRDELPRFARLCRREHKKDILKLRDQWYGDRELMEASGDEQLLDRAFQYYFINRTVWGGRVVFDPERKSRLYYSNPEGWSNLDKKLAHLERVSAKLQGVNITCTSYEDALRRGGKNTFVYADPPYMRESDGHPTDKLYDKSFDVECHRKLARALKKSRAKVMISYDDVPEARELYKTWNIVPLEWKYSGTYAVTKEAKAKGAKEKKVTGKELLILNYEVEER
jgi:DNA adenine methylase